VKKYTPFNRHMLLERDETSETNFNSKVLVPDDFKIAKDFGTYRIMGRSLDCSPIFTIGTRVVVEESMVRTVDLDGVKYFLISENFIVLYENQ